MKELINSIKNLFDPNDVYTAAGVSVKDVRPLLLKNLETVDLIVKNAEKRILAQEERSNIVRKAKANLVALAELEKKIKKELEELETNQ